MRSCERLRKLERLEEKVDPFLRRWGLTLWEEDVDDVFSLRKKDDENGSDDILNKFTLRVGGITHQFDCDCNPCTCELEGEGRTGLNAPINTVRGAHSI
jgi:hypothetical protein